MSSKALAAALLLALPCPRAAAETATVLSAGGGAYMEAFSAFQAAYGAEVAHFDLSKAKPELPPQVRTVVAFGGKAAVYPYPPDIRVVYCMAPGIFLKPAPASPVKISLIPPFDKVLSRLKLMQPGLKTLKVLWMAPDFGQFADAITRAGAELGIQLISIRVTDTADLPSILRREMPGMDAFWLPPDPLLVTPENLLILREFSWANGIPFYGSTKGMTREGAAASVGLSFKAMGEAAAGAALRLEAGEKLPEIVFPDEDEVTLNATAAKRCRLTFPRRVIEEAGYLFP